MKKIATILILTAIGTTPLCAMPSQITFQGTLKQQGIPVNTTPTTGKLMQFIFIDPSTNNQIPGTQQITIQNVQVTNGLFAVSLPIDPSFPWEQYTPYIRVLVGDQLTGTQLLQPDQPLNANLYAVAAIPQGMIAIFAGPCPTGWSSFAPLNNNSAFPMGGNTYGATGGSATSNTDSGVVFISGQGGGSFVSDWKRADNGKPGSPASTLPPYLTVVYCQKL
jgi:hypothetical protein